MTTDTAELANPNADGQRFTKGTQLPDWSNVQAVLVGIQTLRAVQERAIAAGLCSGRRNMVVAAPTNSGKSLVGLIGLLQTVHRGKRAILVEP